MLKVWDVVTQTSISSRQVEILNTGTWKSTSARQRRCLLTTTLWHFYVQLNMVAVVDNTTLKYNEAFVEETCTERQSASNCWLSHGRGVTHLVRFEPRCRHRLPGPFYPVSVSKTYFVFITQNPRRSNQLR